MDILATNETFSAPMDATYSLLGLSPERRHDAGAVSAGLCACCFAGHLGLSLQLPFVRGLH